MTGTRARPWLPAINRHERESRARLIYRCPEPGFWPTLAAAIRCHSRTWRVIAAITAALVLTHIGAML